MVWSGMNDDVANSKDQQDQNRDQDRKLEKLLEDEQQEHNN